MSRKEIVARAKGFAVLLFAILLVLTGRLWYLQIAQGHEFAAQADENRTRRIPISAPRGMIYDLEGRILAGNRLSSTVSIDRNVFDAKDEALVARLAEILRMTPEEILTLIERGKQQSRTYEPIRILRDVDPETVIVLEENRGMLPGVFVEEEWRRVYPFGEVGGNVLGYLRLASPEDVQAGYRNSDLVGDAGLERQYEEFLRGTEGRRLVEVNAHLRPVRELSVQSPVPGNDLYVTLDIELQQVAEQSLVEHLEYLRAQGDYVHGYYGAVVVLDAKSGAVLAMASVPSYDPNRLLPPDRGAYYHELLQSPGRPFIHRAVQAYAPGSIFKPVTGLVFLETGAIGPDEEFEATGIGPYGRLDWSIRNGCWCPAGVVTIVMAMARSANDFFWHIALRPEVKAGNHDAIETIAAYARKLGLGSPTGIDFPGDRAGRVPDTVWKRETMSEPWYVGDTLNVVIGQGYLEVTPLQMAVAYTAFANRGLLYEPYLVERIVSPEGEVLYQHVAVPERIEVSDPYYWEVLVESLRATVQNPRGTSYNALRFQGDRPWGAVATYDPAGKTGSAQRAPGQESHAWFAGFAPAADPEIVVVVFVEEGGSGGAAASPIARRVMDFYFEREARKAGGEVL